MSQKYQLFDTFGSFFYRFEFCTIFHFQVLMNTLTKEMIPGQIDIKGADAGISSGWLLLTAVNEI
jgi:hypothetical protein